MTKKKPGARSQEPEAKTPLTVELWPIARPIPYAKNARTSPARAIDSVAASLKEFGWRQPIVVDAKDVVVAGHKRLLAAQKLGMTEVPVHVAAGLTEAQCKAYRLMDNRSNQNSEWDLELLQSEMSELVGQLDVALTGFEQAEIEQFLKPPPLTDQDETPEEPETPVSKLGDLWILGKHRLLCGDSTDAGSVKRLMGDEKAGLMATDPPYGIDYDSAEIHEHGVSKTAIANDKRKDEELQAFLEKVFYTAKSALLPNAAWYLWHAMLTQGFFAAAAADVKLHRQIIWVKPVLVFGRGQYHWKHELCFFGWVKGKQPPNYAEPNQTTVWEVGGVTQAERDKFGHSTPKPVELFRRPIMKHLKADEVCYDPFSGTGPQFIAAEMTGRRCMGLELDPKFVDVIVTRWERFTGAKATLDGDGRTFDAIKAERAAPVTKGKKKC
jgi:DNA modification methylase